MTLPESALSCRVRPPGSKSLTNRAFVLAALAQGTSRLRGCLVSEDSDLMRQALKTLGLSLRDCSEQAPWTDCELVGQGPRLGLETPDAQLDVGTAGTVARFLSAALCGTGAQVKVDGSPRMRERPMALLLDKLREQGAEISAHEKPSSLPMTLHGRSTPLRGGTLRIERPASSQFVSALAIAALCAQNPTVLELTEGCPAMPYVDMTLATIRAFGGKIEWLDAKKLRIEPSQLQGQDLRIEPDASSASYFLALAAICGGEVCVPDLGSQSLQGDAKFHQVLEQFGARASQSENETTVTGTGTLRGVELDLSDMPDMTLTAAVVALHAKAQTKIRGVEILRHHECDRLAAGATELRKLGAQVQELEDGLDILAPGAPGNPCTQIRRDVSIDTYLDHRMAMAFSLAGQVQINNPGCCEKTFPTYFEVLQSIGAKVQPGQDPLPA